MGSQDLSQILWNNNTSISKADTISSVGGSIRVNINHLSTIVRPAKWDSIGMSTGTVVSLKEMDFMFTVLIKGLQMKDLVRNNMD